MKRARARRLKADPHDGRCTTCRLWRHGKCERCGWRCRCYTDPKWEKYLRPELGPGSSAA
jgi:hypothetical protein